jgi:hypothetical protein
MSARVAGELRYPLVFSPYTIVPYFEKTWLIFRHLSIELWLRGSLLGF